MIAHPDDRSSREAPMSNTVDSAAYERDGYLVLPGWLGPELTQQLRAVTSALLEKASAITAPSDVYDLEPWHRAVGPAGSISVHHTLTVHGSDFNRSSRPRPFLLLEYAAADAWPLRGVRNYGEYCGNLVCGVEPADIRMRVSPVRMPYPAPPTGEAV